MSVDELRHENWRLRLRLEWAAKTVMELQAENAELRERLETLLSLGGDLADAAGEATDLIREVIA